MLASVATSIDFCSFICWNFHLGFLVCVPLSVCLCVCCGEGIYVAVCSELRELCALPVFRCSSSPPAVTTFYCCYAGKGSSRRAWMCVIDGRGCCVGWLVGRMFEVYFLIFCSSTILTFCGGSCVLGVFVGCLLCFSLFFPLTKIRFSWFEKIFLTEKTQRFKYHK